MSPNLTHGRRSKYLNGPLGARLDEASLVPEAEMFSVRADIDALEVLIQKDLDVLDRGEQIVDRYSAQMLFEKNDAVKAAKENTEKHKAAVAELDDAIRTVRDVRVAESNLLKHQALRERLITAQIKNARTTKQYVTVAEAQVRIHQLTVAFANELERVSIDRKAIRDAFNRAFYGTPVEAKKTA